MQFMRRMHNLSDVTIRGWYVRYEAILRRLGYSRSDDDRSAMLLDGILGLQALHELDAVIRGRPVFVVGAGPSVSGAPDIIKTHNCTVIAADSATGFLLQNGIYPDIVVTDLDGDMGSLLEASSRAIMVVHAHGHNADMVYKAARFPRCVGTTQSRPLGRIANFGGFTDGDRAAFLADHFGASVIILLGMDMGTVIGRHSGTRRADRRTKLEKLKIARSLIRWLAGAGSSPVYSVSPGTGICTVSPGQIRRIISKYHAGQSLP